jgi:hypothetical protein
MYEGSGKTAMDSFTADGLQLHGFSPGQSLVGHSRSTAGSSSTVQQEGAVPCCAELCGCQMRQRFVQICL